jgi:hypothetical protein
MIATAVSIYQIHDAIGLADLFWAHIRAEVRTDRGYPAGPIKPGD